MDITNYNFSRLLRELENIVQSDLAENGARYFSIPLNGQGYGNYWREILSGNKFSPLTSDKLPDDTLCSLTTTDLFRASETPVWKVLRSSIRSINNSNYARMLIRVDDCATFDRYISNEQSGDGFNRKKLQLPSDFKGSDWENVFCFFFGGWIAMGNKEHRDLVIGISEMCSIPNGRSDNNFEVSNLNIKAFTLQSSAFCL